MLTEAQQIEIRARTAASSYHNPGGKAVSPTPMRAREIKPIAPSEPDRRAWTSRAACRGMDPEMFFPDRQDGYQAIQAIQAICAECPVRVECLNYALDERERDGIWGGMTGRQRRRLARERRV